MALQLFFRRSSKWIKDFKESPNWCGRIEDPFDTPRFSNLLRSVFSIEKRVQKKRASESQQVWPAQCICLCTAYSRVAQLLKEWHQLDLLGWDTVAMEELVHVMQSGLEMLGSKEQKGLEVAAVLREQEFQEIHHRLHECLNLLCLTLLKVERVRMRKSSVDEESMISQLCAAGLGGLYAEFRAASRADVENIAQSLRAVEKYNLKQILRSFGKQDDSTTSFPLDLHIPHNQLSIRECIGSGSYGAVYQSCWLDHIVAVKEFHSGDRSFETELKALARLRHSNIVGVMGFAFDMKKQRHSIAMEKMDKDLKTLIEEESKSQRPPFPLWVAVSIMLQIAEGMRFLHDNNVIHRDLKPGNVLVRFPAQQVANENRCKFMSVKVADFGTARTDFFTSRVSATPGVGTRAFRAPEVYFCEKSYSRKADVYSFALVCYQILTGTAPFEDIIRKEEFITRVYGNEQRPDLPHDCPAALALLLRRCWTGNPEQRLSFSEICGSLRLLKACLVSGCISEEVEAFEQQLSPAKTHQSHSTRELVKSPDNGFRQEQTGSSERLSFSSSGEVHRGALFTGDPVSMQILSSTKDSQLLKLLLDINHNNLVRVFAFFNDHGKQMLITEHMHHVARNFIPENSELMTLRKRLDICIDAAAGLSRLHSVDIAHTNVSLDSILLNDKLVAKLGGLESAQLCYTDEEKESKKSKDTRDFGNVIVEVFLANIDADASTELREKVADIGQRCSASAIDMIGVIQCLKEIKL